MVGSDRRGTSHSRPWSRKITSQSSELTTEIATSVRHFQAAEVAAGLGSKNNKKRQASKNNKIDIRDDTQHHLSSSWRLFSSQSSPDRRQQSIKYFKQFFIHIIRGEAHCFQLHPLRLQFVLHHLFFSFCCPLPEAPWPCHSDWHWHIQREVFYTSTLEALGCSSYISPCKLPTIPPQSPTSERTGSIGTSKPTVVSCRATSIPHLSTLVCQQIYIKFSGQLASDEPDMKLSGYFRDIATS